MQSYPAEAIKQEIKRQSREILVTYKTGQGAVSPNIQRMSNANKDYLKNQQRG